MLTPESKKKLAETIRGLRARLIQELRDEAAARYRLSVPMESARLSEAARVRRVRLERWLDERVRAVGIKPDALDRWSDSDDLLQPKTAWRKARLRFLDEAATLSAATFLNRLIVLRCMEAASLVKPAVLTGGLNSAAAKGLRDFAPTLFADENAGYAWLLGQVFEELSLDLPGLFGDVGLVGLFDASAGTLRSTVDALDAKELSDAWDDDTTLGWTYQYWNDPQREALDAKINDGGKIEGHEIAAKTQMFTERYMVEWLLQNSLGLQWLAICRKNSWIAEAERGHPTGDGGVEESVLARLDARRAAWRDKRERGEVTLDALMPYTRGDLEERWRYWVPQEIPDDLVAAVPESLRTLKVLDPACGSGHFLVIAFGLLAALYEEEAQHRGESWTKPQIAQWILEDNLHGIDLDPRAVQIAAAALHIAARQYAGAPVTPRRLNLVATAFDLARLGPNDAAVVALRESLAREAGIPAEATEKIITMLAGIDAFGSLVKLDKAIDEAVADAEKEREGARQLRLDLTPPTPLSQVGEGGARTSRNALSHDASEPPLPLGRGGGGVRSLVDRIERFLGQHTHADDLGVRVDGAQLAAGVRFARMVREGQYDLVVGNPPYQGTARMAEVDYITKNYPMGKADLFAAFLQRGVELARSGGLNAMVTMRGWMFLGQFEDLRAWVLEMNTPTALADLGWGAFEQMTDSPITMSIIGRGARGRKAIAVCPNGDPTGRVRSDANYRIIVSGLLCGGNVHSFLIESFNAIEGKPMVYWWDSKLSGLYSNFPMLGKTTNVMKGLCTGDDLRLTRKHWETQAESMFEWTHNAELRNKKWSPFISGAEGRAWIEPLKLIVRHDMNGLVYRVGGSSISGARPQGDTFYFRLGVAFSMIGSRFSGRSHRYRSVIGDMGASVIGSSISRVVCLLNSSLAREVLASLNPGVHFQVGDVKRLPVFPVASSDEIFAAIERAFTTHEAARENSVEFRKPGPSPWTYAQDWAQRAVDRAAGEPLPEYAPVEEPASPTAYVSFALGVALGRFGAQGEGILDAAPTAQPRSGATTSPGRHFDVTSPPNPLSQEGEGETDTPLRVVNEAGRYVDPAWIEAARAARKSPTEAEARVWELVRDRRCLNLKFRREQVIDGFRADFYCPAIGVVMEVDGGIHDDAQQAAYDAYRTGLFETMGLQVLRVRNENVSAEALEALLTPSLARSVSSSPSPSWERGLGGEVSSKSLPLRVETLPDGILFLSGARAHDGLETAACEGLRAAWSAHGAAIAQETDLRTWLRRDFFDHHKALYENRPIWWPLSSSRKTFVAWVAIHRWTDTTLKVLQADHLLPELRALDGELEDLRRARNEGDKGGRAKAERRYAEVQKQREELDGFIAAVAQCAERGAPPADEKCPKRERDAPYAMDLDDGVMVNASALWPLLDPQWKDPRKWWKELSTADGRKDYDWSHLAARYWPSRVAGKCESDPSLAVAHGCFWRLHPARAFAWELRLGAEIRADFTIDERDSDVCRAAFFEAQLSRAFEAIEKEIARRSRKRKGAEGDDEDDAPAKELPRTIRVAKGTLWTRDPSRLFVLERKTGFVIDEEGADEARTRFALEHPELAKRAELAADTQVALPGAAAKPGRKPRTTKV